MGNVVVENLKILGEGLGAGLLGLSNVHYLLGFLLFHVKLIFNFISCSGVICNGSTTRKVSKPFPDELDSKKIGKYMQIVE